MKTIMFLWTLFAASAAFAQPVIPDEHTIFLGPMNASSGTFVEDLSGNALHGTAAGNFAWVPGVYGNALHFAPPRENCAVFLDGTTAYGVIPDHSSLDFGSGDFTLDVMVRLDYTVSGYDPSILFKMTGPGAEYYALEILEGTTTPLFSGRGGGVEWNVPSSLNLTLGSWSHLAGVRSGNDFIIYVNGSETGRETLVVGDVSSTGDLGVGNRLLDNPYRFFPGALDEVRLWSRALSAAELTAFQSTEFCASAAGLVGLYQFNECGGSVITDGSGTGNNGSLIGSVQPVPATWATTACSGSAAYVNLGSSSLLRPAQFTVSAWVNADSIHDGANLIATSAKNFHGFRLFLHDGGKPAFDVQDGSSEGYNIATSPAPIAPGTWHFLSGTFNGSTVRIYVDGMLKASTGGSLSPATYPFVIGADVTPPYESDPFWGSIDELHISDIDRFDYGDCTEPANGFARLYHTYDMLTDSITPDATPYLNDGILRNGAALASGYCGMALDLNGAGAYAVVPEDDHSLDITDLISICFWIYPRSDPDNGLSHIVGKPGDNTNTDWCWVVMYGSPLSGEPNDLGLAFQIGHNESSRTASVTYDPTPVPQNQWTFVEAIYTGTEMKLLVNGELRASAAVTVTMDETDEPLVIGVDSHTSSHYLNGLLDELRIYHSDRSAPEPSFTILTPSLGDQWQVALPNAACTEWTFNNLASTARIDLYDGGSFVTNIASGVPVEDSLFCWTVPCAIVPGVGYQIRIQSEEDSAVFAFGEPFTIAPECGPLAPDSLVIQIIGNDAHLHWQPVNTDSCGGALCGATYYLVFFEDDAQEPYDYDFLAYTTDTTYTHAGVVRFSDHMFYNVVTYNGTLAALSGVLSNLDERFSLRAFTQTCRTQQIGASKPQH